MYFNPKMAWPPATYDVISRNHSNWPSLNLSQKVRKGWKKQLVKTSGTDVLSSREKLRKTSGEGGIPPPSPPPCTSEG